MFMYAMVKAMAIKNKTAMAFNLHEGFDNDFQYQRKLELQYLNVDLGKHAPFAVFDYKGARYAQIISKNWEKYTFATISNNRRKVTYAFSV